MNKMTVLVTGASAGIGEATAAEFAKAGARLILVARRKERLEKLSGRLRQQHDTESIVLPLDLGRHRDIAAHLAGLPERWGQIDILVNNAGLARGVERFQDGSIEDSDEVLNVNIRGLIAMSRAVIPSMIARNSGHIVNLGSIAGHQVYPGSAIYCASKYAVRALSEGMKMDLQGTNIRVTSIDPGLVASEFSLVRFRGQKELAEVPYENMKPLEPKDVAEAIVWAASRPGHVNIASMVIFPTDQASAMLVSRHAEST